MSIRQIGWAADEIAILRSVLYASIFEYPLTLRELRQTLLERERDESAILRVYQTSARLRQEVEYREGFFFPRGRSEWLLTRLRRRQISLSLLGRHRRIIRIICAIPFVRLVALSGSVAALNADQDADVDLFIVARGRHAWSVTLAIVLLTKLARRRRVICPNFVMADTDLRVERQDVFSANQMIHLQPVAGEDAFRELLAANPFVRQFYPNFLAEERCSMVSPPGAAARTFKRLCEIALAGPSVPIEWLSRKLYRWHLGLQTTSWRTPSDVRLSSDCLKLHSRSHRSVTLGRFDWLCREALKGACLSGLPAELVDEIEISARQAVNS